MSIITLMAIDGSQDYYNESLKNTLESHMSYLRSSNSTMSQAVTMHQGIVYKADLYGLLNDFGIKPCFHWLVMRLNDFLSPHDFNDTIASLLIPSEKELESIRQSWRTSQKINA
jgi:hypothetical protein